MNISKTLTFFPTRWIVSLAALTALASCSGGGCPACNVPAFNAPTIAPGSTPTPPGFVPPPATPTPAPIAGAACVQGAPNSIALGAAAPFALLGGAGITNTGNMFVNFATGATSTTLQNGFGNFNDDLIGAYPTTTVTGITGANDADGATAIYATGFNSNAPFLTAAQNALTTAYTAATAVHPGTIVFLGGVDLSQASSGVSNCGPAGNAACGVGTLGAGVYSSPSTMSITAGPLTLDGGGNANAVFIFQIGSAFTMSAPGGNMILANGASGCNIYFADLSGATLGGVATGASFFGNILAPAGGITINTAITGFKGRALSGTASVSISAPVTGLVITNPGGN